MLPPHFFRSLTIGFLLSLGASNIAHAQAEVDFKRHADGFALDHGLTGLGELEVDFEDVIDKAYVHVNLGLFDVYHPIPDLDNTGVARTFQEICSLLLEVQQNWLKQMQPSSGRLKTLEADIKTVGKWVQSWRTGKLADLDQDSDHDLFIAFKAKDKYVEAAARLRSSFLLGESLGLNRDLKDVHTAPLILCPTRREFVRLVCYAGLLFENERPKYWADNLHEWIEGRVMDMRVLALEYVDSKLDVGDIYGGIAMDAKRPDELAQHVVQRAFLSLLRNYYGDRFDPALAVGFAINFNIDIFGVDHGRLEGDPRGRSTPPREVFIPGGNPDGGFLPPLSAESPWRELEGEFRYVHKLAAAQESGNLAKQNRQERLQSFQLRNDSGTSTFVVSSPFLGTPAIKAPMPPSEFIGDYQEFFRAYRTAFMHWLRSEAGSSKKDSAKRFALLLAAVGEGGRNEDAPTFEEIVPKIYDDVPLSDSEQKKECLEGRFLRWLQQQQ
ncbi:MAG: hypothetical protein OSB10_09280 [Planctomycetota bacterium]|nr:hypothetical protein [Planctomycetota bacterium]